MQAVSRVSQRAQSRTAKVGVLVTGASVYWFSSTHDIIGFGQSGKVLLTPVEPKRLLQAKSVPLIRKLASNHRLFAEIQAALLAVGLATV
jgi:hypothetical protein